MEHSPMEHDVSINDKICIHADDIVLTVHASDVVESVREFQHLHREIERLRKKTYDQAHECNGSREPLVGRSI